LFRVRESVGQPWERVSEERQIEIGLQLIAKKEELPHGHFRRWVENSAGLAYSQARRWMRKARAIE
jgi:hypothetical protein